MRFPDADPPWHCIAVQQRARYRFCERRRSFPVNRLQIRSIGALESVTATSNDKRGTAALAGEDIMSAVGIDTGLDLAAGFGGGRKIFRSGWRACRPHPISVGW
jgi:hypothetical protein